LNHPDPKVSQFFSDVANATIVSQGFNIRYRSIQPYLPIQSYIDVAAGLSDTLKDMKKSYLENGGSLDSEIAELLKDHIKDVVILENKRGKKELDKFFPRYTKAKVVEAQEDQNTNDVVPGDEQDTYDDPGFSDDGFYNSDSLRGFEDVPESTQLTIARKSTSKTDSETVKCKTNN
jgi:hypothetical protein